MTEKQTQTLLLFAQNYSVASIAYKQKVERSTIRERIKALSKSHSKEFDNAASLRNAYKDIQKAILNTRILLPTDDVKKTF